MQHVADMIIDMLCFHETVSINLTQLLFTFVWCILDIMYYKPATVCTSKTNTQIHKKNGKNNN